MYHGTQGQYWRNRCGLRACFHRQCRENYAKKRLRIMQEMQEDNNLNYFFTLTLDPKKLGSDKEAWDKIPLIWSKFRKRLSRKYPEIRWFAILEKHTTNNRPHVHGMWDMFVDASWLRQSWEECGGGVQIDLQYVKQGDITTYLNKALNVVKYFGKKNMDIAEYLKPGQRIFWYSANMVKREKHKNCAIGFVGNTKLFGFSGNPLLTFEETCSRINENIDKNHKGDSYYEKRQIWSYVEATFSPILTECSENGKPYLASDRGKQKGYESSSVFAGAKGKNQCLHQETFEWYVEGKAYEHR